jgi:putative transferase (TIGR04331 family)
MINWTPDEMRAGIRRCEDDANWVLAQLVEPITELSGLPTSEASARRLVGHWLMHLSHQVHGLSFTGETKATDAELPVFSDHQSHHRAFVGDDEYRRGLHRAMSAVRNGNTPAVKLRSVTPGTNRTAVRSAVRRTLIATVSGRGGVLITQPYIKLPLGSTLRHVARSSAWSRWRDVTSGEHHAPDAARRLHLASRIDVRDDKSALLALAIMLLPSDVVEGRAGILSDVMGTLRTVPSAVYSANGLQFVSAFQVLAASCADTKTPVAVHQHGGHFGLDEVHAAENVEVAAADCFYTYGWTDSRPNVAPLPTAMPATAASNDRRRLLIMSLETSDVIYRLQPFCLPEHAHACLASTRTFLTELGDGAGFSIVLRSGSREHEIIGASVTRDDPAVTGTVSASASGLVVHNYFGTSWLETLAMNVPTVCIVPPNIHRFREAARPFVDALRRHGIIHDDPREAARFVRGLAGDARSWWNQPDLQADRERFVATYANYSDDWLERWRDELTRLSR